MSQATSAPPRRDKTGRDMLLSLGVLLVPILLVGALLRACGSADPTVVDTAPAIEDARSAGFFPVVVPQDLDGWQPVQAAFRRAGNDSGSLRLGYLSPSGGQVLLVVSNEGTVGLLASELGQDVRPEGETSVDGQAWASSVVRGDERALVRTETVRSGDRQTVRTIIVVGHASLDELKALAASLG